MQKEDTMKRLAIVLVCLAVAMSFSATVFAKGKAVSPGKWHVPGDFATIQEAIDDAAVSNGDTIFVGPGNHDGALLTKGVEIKGTDGTVINSGPLHPAGLTMGFRLLAGSDGATISHLAACRPWSPNLVLALDSFF